MFKRLMLLPLLLWQMPFSWAGSMAAPEDIVRHFIADYYRWNSEANQLADREKTRSGRAMEVADGKYRKLLNRYCLPNFKGEPIVFGSESSHEPGKEVVVSQEVSHDKAIVRTKHTNSRNFVSDYEYRFIKMNSRWYLVALDYVDGDGKYPGL